MDMPSTSMSAYLFPHSHASEAEAKRILSFFDALSIFQPWHMENPFPVSPGHGLNVLHPPEPFKPMDGFLSLLSEYKTWMRQHSDRGYASAMAALRHHGRGEDATWDIRRFIREAGEGRERFKENATRWHLLLHLASEGEERLKEAGEALKRIREKGSPLRDAIDEGDPQGLLDDLADFDADQERDPEFIQMIVEAWCALFGGMVGGDGALVTLSPKLFDQVSGMLPEEGARGLRFSWPDLSIYEWEEFDSRKNELGSIQGAAAFREAFGKFPGNPAGELSGLIDLTRGLDAVLPENRTRTGLRVLRLAPASGGKTGMETLAGLAKFLFLVEASGHE